MDAFDRDPAPIGEQGARDGARLRPPAGSVGPTRRWWRWYDDGIATERDRFRQLRLHALEAVAIRLSRERRYSDALQAALHAVAAEPLRETAHRAVIEVHVAEGNLAEAVLQYERYRDVLVGELGIRPSFAIDDLVRRAQPPNTIGAPKSHHR